MGRLKEGLRLPARRTLHGGTAAVVCGPGADLPPATRRPGLCAAQRRLRRHLHACQARCGGVCGAWNWWRRGVGMGSWAALLAGLPCLPWVSTAAVGPPLCPLPSPPSPQVVFDEAGGAVGVRSEGETARAKFVVGDPTYFREKVWSMCVGVCVCVFLRVCTRLCRIDGGGWGAWPCMALPLHTCMHAPAACLPVRRCGRAGAWCGRCAS